jgi:hypothetical protein
MTIRPFTTLVMMIGLAVGALPLTGHAQRGGPCDRIVAACAQAGFVPHGGRAGYGLGRDCVRPIIEGLPQPPRAILPLPLINPRIVVACRTTNPSFAFGPATGRRRGMIPLAEADGGPPPPTPTQQGAAPSSANAGGSVPPLDSETPNGPAPKQAGGPSGPSVAESGSPPGEAGAPPGEAGPPPSGPPRTRGSEMGPCERILAACRRAGFMPGGAKSGLGLQADCVRPIMSSGQQPRRAAQPLPPISPRIVSACRASNPSFGQPRAGHRPPNGTESPPADSGATPPQSEPGAAPPHVGPNDTPPANE